MHIKAGRKANGNRRVPDHSVVRVTFCGYDPNGGPVFVFFYPTTNDGAYLPPHDHRDNMHGGLAFSTFHPGTQLPQMPYAI